MRARHEGARFDSDVFLIADGILPADVVEAAQVQVTRIVPETFVPPLPGTEVRRAVDAERDEALDLTDVVRRLPAGLTRDGEPVVLDLDFLDGTKGAHVNISGISGVATKTSYATFLLYSLFNSGVLGAAATNTKGLIFNVKGEDLLFLDHANTRLDDDQRQRYAQLGLPPARSARSACSPRRARATRTARPATGARTTGVRPLYWTIADFCRDGMLPFLFADAEDERQQYTIVVQAVAAQLRAHALAGDTSDGAVRIDGTTVRTFRELLALIESKLIPADPDDDPDPRWSGRAVSRGTVNAFVRRLAASERHVEHLVRADLADAATHAIDLDAQQVTVVDLHLLHDRAKRFVVGAVLRQAFDAKEATGTSLPLQFVVLDELNKYAPATPRARSRRSSSTSPSAAAASA